MNVIIVGCGKVGQKLAEQLNSEENINITVIDINHSIVNKITSMYDTMGISGNGTDLDILTDANIKDADILIAVTGSDEINLLACLFAKKSGNCQTIARIKKPEYNKSVRLYKDDLGLTLVINPERTAANEIARLLRFPSAIQIDTFAKGRVEILKLKIPDGSVLDNMKIADLRSKLNCDILVCGVERGKEAFIPNGDFVLQSKDRISIIASIENGTYFFNKIGIKTDGVKNTMIVGGGATAYYLASILSKSGIKVKIIEKNPLRCDELYSLLPDVEIICADGTENQVLLEEGLENAKSFVALTNIDEENVLLSLYAKSITDGKLITKINRLDYDKVVEGLDLGTTICPKDITAEYILKFVRAKMNSMGDNSIETMHLILDGKAEAIEFRVGGNSELSKTTIDKLPINDNTLIACINRNGKIIIPRGSDTINSGDTIVVVTTNSGYKDIHDILKQR